jgi:hypothetical protein
MVPGKNAHGAMPSDQHGRPGGDACVDQVADCSPSQIVTEHTRTPCLDARGRPSLAERGDPLTLAFSPKMGEQPGHDSAHLSFQDLHPRQLVSDGSLKLRGQVDQSTVSIFGLSCLKAQRPLMEVYLKAFVSVSTSLESLQPYT